MTESKNLGGRPSIYSEELADRICEIVATNPLGLPRLCQKFPEMPNYDTINTWRWTKDGFSVKYAKAKMVQAELMAESIEDVAYDLINEVHVDESGQRKLDSGLLGQARLIIDNRKWTASKLAPKIYGDQKRVEELEGENERVKAELQALRDKLNKVNTAEY